MNKAYRLIWNSAKECWIVVAESVKNCSSIPCRIVGPVALMAALLCGTLPAHALDPSALPTGGQIVAGSGSISQSGSTMTVNQGSDRMIANWNTFNIGQNASVAFRQPSASSVALNRISDQNPSQIMGSLSANGQVFLVNPSGIIFGQTARVDVGGLVASSLGLTDDNFLAGKYSFEKNGRAGAVENLGSITAQGGVVALIAPQVKNAGTITANSGSVVMAAGDKVNLDFVDNSLVTYSIEQGAVDALAENKGLIKADSGLVVMTAKAADSLTGAVVNNTGTIEAKTLESKAGRILLLSDMEHGETIVGGTLDASAPNGGDGGFIETSAAKVSVNDGVKITTSAATGKTGHWLIDPVDITIASSGGDITGSTIAAALLTTDVTLDTSGTGTCTGVACGALAGTNGDITINDNINVTGDLGAARTLTLKASRDIKLVNGKSIDATAGGNGQKLNVVLWSDSDATGGGAIFLDYGSSIKSNGGNITLSGGTDITTGYAQGRDSVANFSNGITISGATIQSGGGDITMRGRGANIYGVADNGNQCIAMGVEIGTSANAQSTATLIDSGTGKVSLTGKSGDTITDTAGKSYHAVEIGTGQAGYTGGITIRSANTGADAISITGDASTATSASSYPLGGSGVQIINISNRNVLVEATAGGVAINGTASQSANMTSEGWGFRIFNNNSSYFPAVVAAGPISITGKGNANLSSNNEDIKLDKGTLGYAAGTGVTSSSGNITLNANTLSLDANSRVQSSGALTIQPRTAATTIGIAGGAGTLSLPASYFSTNFSNGFSNVSVGNATTGAITVGGATILKDSTTFVSGNDITVNGNITAADDTGTRTLTLKATRDITLAADNSIDATAGGNTQKLNVVLQSNSADTGGSIQVGTYNGTASTIKSNGGDITLSGGSNIATGFALGRDGVAYHSSGIFLGANSTLDSRDGGGAGGNIVLRGKGATVEGSITGGLYAAHGVYGYGSSGPASIYSGTGTISIHGVSQGGNSAAQKNSIGVKWDGSATSKISSANTGTGAITIVGDASLTNNNHWPLGVELNNTVEATNGGGISLTGYGGTTSNAGYQSDGVKLNNTSSITSTSGPITITGTRGTGGTDSADVYFEGGDISSTTGNITLNANSLGFYTDATHTSYLQSSDSLIIQPRTAGTTIGIAGGAGTLALSAANFSTNFVNGFSNITVGNDTAGAITVGGATTLNDNTTFVSGNDIAVNGNITAANDTGTRTLTLKAARNITLAGNSIDATQNGNTQKLNVVLWSDSGATGNGYISIQDGSVIKTNGGRLVLAGGLDDGSNGGTASDGIPDGFAKSGTIGVGIGTKDVAGSSSATTLQTAGGDILIRGQATAGTLQGVYFSRNGAIDAGTGTLTLSGKSSGGHGVELGAWDNGSQTITAGTIHFSGTTDNAGSGGFEVSDYGGAYFPTFTAGAGGLTIYGESTSGSKGVDLAANITTTGGGSILISSPDTVQFYKNGSTATHTVNAGSGDITLRANGLTFATTTAATLAGSGALLVEPYTAGTTIGIAGGSGILSLPASDFSTNFVYGFSGITIGNATAGLVSVGGSTLSYNDPLTIKTGNSIFFSSTSLLTGNGNNLTLWSRAGGDDAATDAVAGSVWLPVGSSISTGGGSVTIGGGNNPVTGYALGDGGATSSENNARYRGVTVNGTIDAGGGSISILGKGTPSFAARGVSIGGVVGTTGNGAITMSGIAHGASDGLALGDATVGINGTVLAVNGAVSLTGTKDTGSNGINISTTGSRIIVNGTGSLALTATGAINGTGYIQAGGTTSLTAGTNAITLANSANDFTGAVNVVSGANVSLVDSSAMTLGAVTASGTVDIATLAGDLTLTGAINTTDATANAIKLNAGKSTAAGISTGGNIVISGSPTLSTGAGGRTTLYTGSVSGSTGLTALAGSGSGNFRYNSDESATNYTTALGTGVYAVYREQPTVTITAADAGKTYDGLAYSGGNGVTCSGFVNGDTSAVLGGTPVYSGSSQGAVNAASYTITPSGYTNGLGYALAYADGSLTVSPAALSVTATSDSKTYNGLAYSGGNGVNCSGFVNGETSAVLGGSLGYGGSSQGAINAGSYTITPQGLTSGNYTITYNNGSLTVSPAALSVTASDGTKTYGQTPTLTAFTSTGLQNGETIGSVTLASAGTAATANAAGSPYAITASNATGGSFNAGNYTITYNNGSLTVSPAALSVTASDATKTYGQTPTLTAFTSTGLQNGETIGTVTLVSDGATATASVSGSPYAIIPSNASGGTFSAGNYTITYNNGSLTVNPASSNASGNSSSPAAVISGDPVRNSVVASITSPQIHVNGTQNMQGNGGTADSGSSSDFMGPGAGSGKFNESSSGKESMSDSGSGTAHVIPDTGSAIFTGNDLGGLVTDKTGYRTVAEVRLPR